MSPFQRAFLSICIYGRYRSDHGHAIHVADEVYQKGSYYYATLVCSLSLQIPPFSSIHWHHIAIRIYCQLFVNHPLKSPLIVEISGVQALGPLASEWINRPLCAKDPAEIDKASLRWRHHFVVHAN